MPIRSMTGFAQVKGQVNGQTGFTLSLKSVNHRFLDLHFRMPAECDGLEMKLRRMLKEKLARGHIEVTLSMDRGENEGFKLNRELVSGYIQAFRAASTEFGLMADPDLNVVLRLPGAMGGNNNLNEGELETAVLAHVDEVLANLNRMREEEGRGIDHELRERMKKLLDARQGIEQHRHTVLRSYAERLAARIQELVGAQAEKERIVQEAALLVDRSDIQEELVRLSTHVKHFLGLLDEGQEIGKKLDFLLQEMNRESNTLLSKTSGLAGEALRITEMGLLMKAEIEKCREQVQNIE
jgi:uncharacterized protein (TIGR00255 family)